MAEAVIDEKLINLVGNGIGIVSAALLGNQFELVGGKHLPRGIIGSVQNHRARAVSECGGEFGGVESPVRRMKPHVAGCRSANDGIGTVVLVKRLEDHDLVTRVDDSQQRSNHRFRSAAANRHLPFRIDLEARVAVKALGDGAAKLGRSPGNLILVIVCADCIHCGFLHFFRGGKIREALGKVHRVMLEGQARHFANHRLGEPPGLLRYGRPSAGAGGKPNNVLSHANTSVARICFVSSRHVRAYGNSSQSHIRRIFCPSGKAADLDNRSALRPYRGSLPVAFGGAED